MKNISKLLSLVLRHKPEVIGITLDKNGWVSVEELLSKIQTQLHGDFITITHLEEIVSDNDKQRFSFNEDKTKIRANQGHSISKIDLGLKTERPPMKLYHGTVSEFLGSINNNGLLKMNRNHVHLSDNLETATNVGNRRGKAIILLIDSGRMYADGVKFYKSVNGVWLTDCVLPKYIKMNF